MSRDSERLKAVDLLIEKNRTPAIMLHRPYPPIKVPRVRSRFGGLPLLPEAVPWPWGRRESFKSQQGTNVPLHFLAQIDCAELPQLDPRMPTEGFLFFFCRNDVAMSWGGYDDNPKDYSRVIYVPHIPESQTARQPPPELPPLRAETDGKTNHLGSRYMSNPYWVLSGEIGPAFYPSWPIVPLRIDSWPEGDSTLYNHRKSAHIAASIVAATGLPTMGLPEGIRTSPPQVARLEKKFPYAGVLIDRIARLITLTALEESNDPSPPFQQVLEILQRIIVKGQHWIARAKEIGWDLAPSEEDASNFRNWLDEIDKDSAIHKMSVRRILAEAVGACITYAGGSPSMAALIPPDLYNAYENYHLPFKLEKHGFKWLFRHNNHQMLGHFPHWSHELSVDDPVVRLFYVYQDSQIEHWDGQISFYINPDDLIYRRFENAWASIDNG